MMSEVRSERGALWSDAETLALIAVWSEENVQTALDEQLRNSHVFKFISLQLLDQGYIRTPEQCRIRIKGLKRKYTLAKDSIKRGCSASGRKICRFYEQLDVVLGSRVASERPVLMDAIPTTGESQDIKEEQSSPHSDISQRVECRNGHCSSEEPDLSLGETSSRQFEPQPSTSAFCTLQLQSINQAGKSLKKELAKNSLVRYNNHEGAFTTRETNPKVCHSPSEFTLLLLSVPALL
ncbi:myb/SANT-like DNA-binding domain-containing protein 2 isoform X2 [Scyliorhinus torazame]|uniref:myb/SANT-like DNA-binding domain-containing protein 2 isoform X2 n=1 Tax=Scyliorhinus torazame TaxID=75743 RepID=UPI003B59682E